MSPATLSSEIWGHTILRVNASHTHHSIFFTCPPPQRVRLELALRILLSKFCCLWVENSFCLPIIFRDNENLSKIRFSLRLSCPWPWHILLWKESEAVVVWWRKGGIPLMEVLAVPPTVNTPVSCGSAQIASIIVGFPHYCLLLISVVIQTSILVYGWLLLWKNSLEGKTMVETNSSTL